MRLDSNDTGYREVAEQIVSMTREEMLALLERRVSGWQDRDSEALAADYAETAVLDSPMTGQAVGREAIRRAYEALLEAYGKLSIAPEHVLVDGDQMVSIFKFSGTHTGTLFGMKGTGKQIVFRGVTVYTVANGQIVHERRIYDFTGFLMKLAVITARPSG